MAMLEIYIRNFIQLTFELTRRIDRILNIAFLIYSYTLLFYAFFIFNRLFGAIFVSIKKEINIEEFTKQYLFFFFCLFKSDKNSSYSYHILVIPFNNNSLKEPIKTGCNMPTVNKYLIYYI